MQACYEPTTILNFVTQEELENLDDDPRVAFMELVNHAQRRFDERTWQLDQSDNKQTSYLGELRHNLMNVIVDADKRLEIEPFSTMEVPEWQKFNIDDH